MSKRALSGQPRLILLLGLCCALTACIHLYHGVEVESVPTAELVAVTTPVKAHLTDGSVVIYPSGVSVGRDSLSGAGTWYDAMRGDSTPMTAGLPMSRVAGLEAFSSSTDAVTSLAVSTLATAGMAVAVAGAAVAIFGSCPTVYTMTPGGEVLEAELFSYSIAPLLEARDIDLLGASDSLGYVTLEIRNEALETHQINHLELIEVSHSAGETVLPDERGRPLAVASLVSAEARDRSGRDISAILDARDSASFATADAMLAQADLDDMHDHIDLVVPKPVGRDSVAVVLRLRNSLLNTVLFYDVMLGSAGAKALDWLGTDLQRIGPAVELGEWYVSRFGMWIHVEEDGEYREVARVADVGPIAWKDVAVLIPVPAQGDSLRVRLGFVMDEWRIDRAAIALDVRRVTPRTVPIGRVTGADGVDIPDARPGMAHADEHYVETRPGQWFTAHFDVGPAAAGATRTFLLSSQGYYIEWLRPEWVRTAENAAPFVPQDESLLVALRRWHDVKPEFERSFYETRLPVR